MPGLGAKTGLLETGGQCGKVIPQGSGQVRIRCANGNVDVSATIGNSHLDALARIIEFKLDIAGSRGTNLVGLGEFPKRS
jgi:hypothetical protein